MTEDIENVQTSSEPQLKERWRKKVYGDLKNGKTIIFFLLLLLAYTLTGAGIYMAIENGMIKPVSNEGLSGYPFIDLHEEIQILDEYISYGDAVYFCATLVTTIGYGDISPRTAAGRVFTMVFASIGIPLFLLTFGALGNFLTQKLKRTMTFIKRKIQTRSFHQGLSESSTESGKTIVEEVGYGWLLLTISLILVIYMIGAVFLFSILLPDYHLLYIECLYFTIISLTTIGYGDLAPSAQNRIYAILYLTVGFILVSVWIVILKEIVLKAFRKISTEENSKKIETETNEDNEEAGNDSVPGSDEGLNENPPGSLREPTFNIRWIIGDKLPELAIKYYDTTLPYVLLTTLLMVYLLGGAAIMKTIEGHLAPDFVYAIFSCWSTVSTIGYGAFSPLSLGGTFFIAIYGLIGIPQFILFLLFIGRIMTIIVVFITNVIRTKVPLVHKWTNSSLPERKISSLRVFFAFTILVSYLLLVSIPVQQWEIVSATGNNPFLTAVYFSFTSITTIGFGDIVPRSTSEVVYTMFYVTFGMALVVMCSKILLDTIKGNGKLGQNATDTREKENKPEEIDIEDSRL